MSSRVIFIGASGLTVLTASVPLGTSRRDCDFLSKRAANASYNLRLGRVLVSEAIIEVLLSPSDLESIETSV